MLHAGGGKCIQIIPIHLRCDVCLFLVHDKFVPQMDETDTFITLRLIIIKLFFKDLQVKTVICAMEADSKSSNFCHLSHTKLDIQSDIYNLCRLAL